MKMYGAKKRTYTRKNKKSVSKAKKSYSRKKTTSTTSLARQVKKLIVSSHEQKVTKPISLFSDSVGVRRVQGYITNPLIGAGAREGKFFPLIFQAGQFPANGTTDNHTFVGRDYLLQSFNYQIVLDFNRTGCWSNWVVCLVKMNPRQTAITSPTSVILETLYPESTCDNGTGYVRMTPKVIGRFNQDYGTIVWRKKLQTKIMRTDVFGGVPFGANASQSLIGRDGVMALSYSSLNGTGDSTPDPAGVAQYSNMRMHMQFSIKMNKKIHDNTVAADVQNIIPRYNLLFFEECQSGRPTNLFAAPEVVIDDVLSYTTFKDV